MQRRGIIANYPPFFTHSTYILNLIRYLTAVDQSYYNSLSSASQASLAFQGGPFRGDELAAFDQDLLRDEMVSLRLWDDAAKVPGIRDSTPRARSYFNRIVDHLEGKEVSA